METPSPDSLRSDGPEGPDRSLPGGIATTPGGITCVTNRIHSRIDQFGARTDLSSYGFSNIFKTVYYVILAEMFSHGNELPLDGASR